MAFCFLTKEEKEDYTWVLNQLQNILSDAHQPIVMITDCELALLNAIEQCFPDAKHMLCIWHIEKNMLIHMANAFKEEEKEVQDEFMNT